MALRAVTDGLVSALEVLNFEAPVAHVYNPFAYARSAWDRYGNVLKRVLSVGMNPGPFGMPITNQGIAS